MSYDLYFYKRKGSNMPDAHITAYLNHNLVSEDEAKGQWFFENKDTDVYYFFDRNKSACDPESIRLYESFPGFENTNFSFNLNFLRPSFFGIEVFRFVGNMMRDLNLFVLDPQSAKSEPYEATAQELFETWNRTNILASIEQFDEENSYVSPEVSNAVWSYNNQRKKWQEKMGDGYFVPRIFFFKTTADNRIVTMTTWAEHIPNVFPVVDYYHLYLVYRKLFHTVKESVVISRETLLNEFGDYLDDFELEGCKIIHPDNALKVKEKFNTVKFLTTLEKFGVRVAMENLYNAKPD